MTCVPSMSFATLKKPAQIWQFWTWCGDPARWWTPSVPARFAARWAAGYGSHGEPPPIVYTADIFDEESLDLVRDHDIHVNAGSPDMIEQLGAVAPGRNITLRINPGFGHGHSQKTNTGGEQSKHGIWHEQLDHCLRRVDHHGLSVTGVHMHIGSGTDLEHLSQVCGALEKAALTVGRTVTSISAGGGLPVPYNENQSYVDLDLYFRLWDDTRKRLEQAFQHPIRLEVEPGRYLVAESGYLVTEIRAVKRMGHNLFYLVDAGFNNLARPILYGAYHPLAIAPADGDVNRPSQSVVVGGPLCESGDIFTQQEGGFVCQRELPVAGVGDYLVIGCRRRLRVRHGLELQFQAAGRRGVDPQRPRPPDPRTADVRGPGAGRDRAVMA